MTSEKMYYIMDSAANYYTLDKKGQLVRAKGLDEAGVFTLVQANKKIGTGRRSRFYSLVEADTDITEVTYDAPEYDEVKKPTMFDSLDNQWEERLSQLCYMSSHINEYQNNLSTMLSDVDKELCDLMHYLEFNELPEVEMAKVSHMIKDCRCRRREIKDEMEKTDLMKSTFLDNEFSIKVHQSLEMMERMKTRQYTPRVLTDLFQNTKSVAC